VTADPQPAPGDVVVVEYDPRWPARYAAESARIRAACGDTLAGIEHVGSTAVPGLAAKPIIDIIVFLHSFEAGAAVVPGMEALGYEYRGEYGVPGRHYFRQTRPRRSVHVHMYAAGHPDALRLIAFRDALRADDDLRDAYAALKRDNARTYPNSSMLYTGAKSGFIERVNRRIAGTPPEPVVVVDYDPAWPTLYGAEAARIREALGSGIAGIEHIGSTSVPGLAAKPIIDIMALVESFEAAEELVAPMEMLGYHYFGEYGIPRRHYFNRPGYHAHVLEPGSDQATGHLAFRDYLRAHPETSADYARLKRDLAARHRDDRDGYTDAKAEFIRATIATARRPA
jgi:GrpB-like predicted nucleotidyltransferase (UPF0157 family)